MTRPALGDLQQLTLLAVARLGDGAFGGAIRDELQRVARRRVSISTVYVTLVRMENQGFVTSKRERTPAGRGGKAKRYFRLTRKAWTALESSRDALHRMWEGVEPA
jgi:DNA-binding PadR family transcriptional regulator